ncbi:MAG TPA: hypothetical protein VHB98_03725, partial [Chloroflexota bacterium]|nr:hypothetical protein [Chloroflexota bacterium]
MNLQATLHCAELSDGVADEDVRRSGGGMRTMDEWFSSVPWMKPPPDVRSAKAVGVWLGDLAPDAVAHLDVHYRDWNIAHVRRLAASPVLGGIVSLNLSANSIDAQALAVLAASTYLTALTALDLGHTSIGDEGLQMIAAAPAFASLTALTVHTGSAGPTITTRGIEALAASRYL